MWYDIVFFPLSETTVTTLKSRRQSIPTSALPLYGRTLNSPKTVRPNGCQLSPMGPVKEAWGHPRRWSWPHWRSRFVASPSTATPVPPERRCTARTGPSCARTVAWSMARTSPSLMWTSSSAKSSKKATQCVIDLRLEVAKYFWAYSCFGLSEY